MALVEMVINKETILVENGKGAWEPTVLRPCLNLGGNEHRYCECGCLRVKHEMSTEGHRGVCLSKRCGCDLFVSRNAPADVSERARRAREDNAREEARAIREAGEREKRRERQVKLGGRR